MASFCGYCGSELGSSDRFCGACGKGVSETPGVTDNSADFVSDDVGRHKVAGPPRRRLRVVHIALFAVLGVAAGIGVGFLVTDVLFAGETEGQLTPSPTRSDASPTSTVADGPTTTESPATTSTTSSEVDGFGDVFVVGEPLPVFEPGTGDDPALGLQAPSLTGEDGTGTGLTIGPDGKAKIVVLLAHWCPHCQAQMPVLQSWLDSGGLPMGVDLYAVAVLTDRLRDESTWPPAEWLAGEGWTYPTIEDDDEGRAATALGVTGVPLFVVLDGNNTVLGRIAGELDVGQLDTLAQLASEGDFETTNSTIPGDLDLQKPMARPDCDGSYVTFLGASVNPDRYAEEIGDYLERYADAEYLRTDATCTSLRAETESGDAIYAVFFGPFATFEEACQARTRGPPGSYVKPLDNVSDPEELPEC